MGTTSMQRYLDCLRRPVGRVVITLASGAAAAACGNAPEETAPGEAKSVAEESGPTRIILDETVLAPALEDEERLAGEGHQLLGRAWASPDTYTAFLEGPDGQPFVYTITGRRGVASKLKVAAPQPGESFGDYVARAATGPIFELADLPGNFVLFDVPDSDESEIRTTEQAATLEEVAAAMLECRNLAVDFCNQKVGFHGAGNTTQTRFSIKEWAPTFGNKNAWSLAYCDGGNGGVIVVSPLKSTVSYQPPPPGFFVTTPPLGFFHAWDILDYSYVRLGPNRYLRRFGGVDYKFEFGSFSGPFNAACVHVSDHGDYVRRDPPAVFPTAAVAWLAIGFPNIYWPGFDGVNAKQEPGFWP